MYHRCFILVILFFDVVSLQSIARDDQVSFTVDLIHRDSPESPFYNHSLTQSKLLAKDGMRSHARVYGLNSSSVYTDDKSMVLYDHQDKRKLLESEIMITGRNDYLIKIYDGSNKVQDFLYVDLTTNFVWTKCSRSEQSQLLYNPRLSSSFSEVRSNFFFCELVKNIKVPNPSGACSFKYKDTKRNSEANGDIVNDRLYLSESQTDAKKIYFGCDYSERLDVYDKGVLGMGRGLTSFISQVRNVTKHKFSYCLQHGLSKIIFGDVDQEIERTLVSSPLQPISDSYYLNLESIEVGDSPIDEPFEDTMFRIRIDFGTKWTFLKESMYEHLEKKVREIVKANPIYLPDYGLCYEKNDLERTEFSIVFYFQRKASTRLASLRKPSITINSKSVFAQVDVENGVKYCMTIRKLIGDRKTHSVLGSLAQMGHVVQFDLTQRQVSFAPMDCNSFQS